MKRRLYTIAGEPSAYATSAVRQARSSGAKRLAMPRKKGRNTRAGMVTTKTRKSQVHTRREGCPKSRATA
jgi:ribosomal protein L27